MRKAAGGGRAGVRVSRMSRVSGPLSARAYMNFDTRCNIDFYQLQ